MSSGFLISALAIISVLTTLTVEAIKKLMGDRKYSSNLLAAIVAVILTIAISVCYMIYYAISITPQSIVVILALTFLSFLSSTVGFDKIKQLLEQIKV